MNTSTKKIAGLIAGVTLLGGATVTDNVINPYTDKGNTLEIAKSSILSEAGETKIVADKTEPKVTLEKWNGEVAMGVKYEGITSTGNRPLFSKNVEWTEGEQTMEVVPLDPTTGMEDGGMEINIILNSASQSNVFNFTIENAENLDFFYQAPMWQQNGVKASSDDCDDVHCGTEKQPENVVGSYAVYYKNHEGHVLGQTNYATGKAYHIYRPKVIDAKGGEVWADMNYSNGVLSVTVPQDFLDNAIYPVKVDPTFGYTTCGAASNGAATNRFAGQQVTAPSDGTVTDVRVCTDSTTSTNVKGVMVLQSNLNILTNGVGNSVNMPIQGSPGAFITSSYSSSPTITSGIDYVIGFVFDTISGTSDYYQDNPGTGNRYVDDTNSYATPTNPTDAVSTGSRRVSVYATYTASASTPATPTNPTINLPQGKMNIGGNTKF